MLEAEYASTPFLMSTDFVHMNSDFSVIEYFAFKCPELPLYHDTHVCLVSCFYRPLLNYYLKYSLEGFILKRRKSLSTLDSKCSWDQEGRTRLLCLLQDLMSISEPSVSAVAVISDELQALMASHIILFLAYYMSKAYP